MQAGLSSKIDIYNATHSCDSADDPLTCLRGQEAYVLNAANIAVSELEFYGTWAFVPVVDFEFIIERPSVTLSKGQLNGVGRHIFAYLNQG